MNLSSVVLVLSLLSLPQPVHAGEAEQIAIVKRYVQAWNDSDVQAIMAVRAADAKNYRPPTDASLLVGELTAPTPQTPDERQAYYRAAFAKTPHPHVEVVDAVALDDLVVSRERVTNLADGPGKVGEELTVYQVRDGRIQALWHVRRAVR